MLLLLEVAWSFVFALSFSSFLQNLGAMDVLCCDTTGTLTMDEVGRNATPECNS